MSKHRKRCFGQGSSETKREEQIYNKKKNTTQIWQICCIELKKDILDPNWIVGFIDGEGTFHVGINSNKTTASEIGLSGYPTASFVITQHKKDYNLMVKIKDFFDCVLKMVKININIELEH